MNSSPGKTRSTSTASRAYAPHAPSNIGPSLRYARSERGQGPCSTSCTPDSQFRNGLLVCHLATGQPLATALRLLRGTRSRAGRSDSKRKVKKGKITLGSEGLLFLSKRGPGLSSRRGGLEACGGRAGVASPRTQTDRENGLWARP